MFFATCGVAGTKRLSKWNATHCGYTKYEIALPEYHGGKGAGGGVHDCVGVNR